MRPTACERARAAALTGEVAAPEVERHLQECADCRDELDSLRRVAALVGNAPLEHSPPRELEERALGRVGIATGSQGGGWSRAALVLVPGLAAAAVALAVLGIGWRNDAQDARDQVASLREQSGVPVQSVSLVDPQTHSRAEVTLMSEDRSGSERGAYHLVVTAHDLPPTQPGYHYELWLIGKHGVVPSLGFPVARSDDMVFDFPLGVNPRRYPSVEMTLEPDDGDAGMNGVPMMAGNLVANAP